MNPKSNRIELFKGTPAGPAATPASGSAFDPAKVDKRSGPGAGSTGQSGANQALAGEAARKASGFNLSPMVRENLRLEEKERRIYEEKIKTEAKGVFDRARKDGFEQGYKEGLEAGKTAAYSDAAEEAKARLDSVEQCLHALETARSDLFKENEKFLIELVTQIAKRIVKKEVAADPEWIRRTFLEMIERIPLKENLKLRVNPADLENIQAFRNDLPERLKGNRNIEVVADPEIPSHGCQVDTQWGEMFSTLETELERAHAALTGGS